jgi:transcriptional regulator with XRE-family HTH domain
MPVGTLVARRPTKGTALKRLRKKNPAATEFAKKIERAGISMYELARRSEYSYQHIWNAANARTAGSDEFWEVMNQLISAWEKEQKAKVKK